MSVSISESDTVDEEEKIKTEICLIPGRFYWCCLFS